MNVKYRIVLFLLIVCPFVVRAQYPDLRIQDIMRIPDDSLAIGSLRSAYYGDTVYVTGIVMVPPVVDPISNRTVILWAGNRWVSFLRDTSASATEYAGVNILQFDTTITSTFFDRIQPGDVIRVLCRVSNYPPGPQGLTQIEVITGGGNQVEFLDADKPLPDPIPVEIRDFYIGPIGNQTVQYESGSRYAGMLVELRNVTVVAATRYDYVISDEDGNQMYLRTQSTYYTKKEDIGGIKPALREWEGLKIGQKLSRVRGYITAANVGGVPASFMITPVYPEDIEISITPPEITTLSRPRTMAFPSPADSVPVTFIAYPGDFPIDPTTAQVQFSTDGGNTFQMVAAQQLNDSTFIGKIPPQAPNTLVQYRCWVADTAGNGIHYPANGFQYYRVLDRAPKISDVREPINPDGSSVYTGYVVTLEGVVTADTSDIPARNSPRIYIQDSTAPYSGIFLSTNNPDHPLRGVKRGDRIRVTGEVAEIFFVTALTDIDPAVTVLSSGNEIEPIRVSTMDFAGKSSGELPAEQWESMLVEFRNVVVVDTNADKAQGRNFGEFLVADSAEVNNPNAWMRVETDDGNTSLTTYKDLPDRIVPPIGSRFPFLRGIMYYSFGNYKLVPRKDDDYQLIVTSVQQITNPFASSGITAYPMPVADAFFLNLHLSQMGDVQIIIRDMSGKQLSSQYVGQFPAGFHRIQLSSAKLSAGTYFVEIWQQHTYVGQCQIIKLR